MFKEVLRLWLGGAPKKRIAAQLGLNVNTVRRHVGTTRAGGLARESGLEALDDGLIAAVVSRVQPSLGRSHGEGWAECVAQRAVIEQHLRGGVRLSKIRKLLRRQGIGVGYATLRRFAVTELGFGRRADNTKAILQRADPLEPRLTPAFLEYVQAVEIADLDAVPSQPAAAIASEGSRAVTSRRAPSATAQPDSIT